MTEKSTVRSVTHDLLRASRQTTVFGHPGSAGQCFPQEFPSDFTRDIDSPARGLDRNTADVKDPADLEDEFEAALAAVDMPTVTVVPSAPQKATL